MRRTSFRLSLDEFDRSVDSYEEFIHRITAAQRVIRYKYEKTEVFEAFVLRLVTLWEVFIEEMFVACLSRDSRLYADFRDVTLRKHLSYDEAYAVLTGLSYLDFHGVGDVKGRARQLLVVNPFEGIPSRAADKIDELLAMRNYLAHYSRPSRQKLLAIYRSNYGMQRFREPGDFLWANIGPGRPIRFSLYIKALRDASAGIRQELGPLAAR